MKTRLVLTLCIALLLAAFTACEKLLEVKNINNIGESGVSDIKAAAGVVNGAGGSVARGIAYVMAPYETATDEVYWIGSRDAWNQLDRGSVSDFNNEFTDQAWPFITEGRYMADKAVTLLEGHDAAGLLSTSVTISPNRSDLARAYIYSALVRIAVGEMFSDFVISDKTDTQPPIGESNLYSLNDQAISALGKAEIVLNALASSATKTELLRRVYGLRARAAHSKAVRQLMIPAKTTPANPWVQSAQAVADANAALGVMTADYKWTIDYYTPLLFQELAWEVVGRSELKLENIPNDPITAAADVRMQAGAADFLDKTKYSDRYSALTMTSAREMHLIIAEDYLAKGDATNARSRLNTLRALNSLPQIAATNDINVAMKHERRANTYLQGRRLLDMYRFGVKDARWVTTSEAYTTPGTLLPVT
ncbi:MAG: hypothetical protein ACRERU_07255, partial [Methylococcales bacterium]